ncbi:MAG: YodL domain-containing protein [Syntrophomonas sp.]
MPENSKSKDRIKEITDSLEQGIKDLFSSDRYMEYLRTMSRFHRYSLNNTILIAMQKPNATMVAGFNKWRDQFGRNVKRGEKGIKIIAPTPYKVKKEMEKLDPETKAPMLDRDGKIIIEEVEIKIPLYKVVSVFDVSQTEGRPLPQLADDLTGDVKQYELFIEVLKQASPVPIAFEEMKADMDGYFSQNDKRIAIRDGMSEVQTISAVIHEIAHAKLHDNSLGQLDAAQSNENAEPLKPKSRRTEEVEAESVSYAVCQYYGVQTAANSFGYIAAWSKDKELPELRASLETINKTASGLIEDIDKSLAVLKKEREKTQEQVTPAEPGQAAPNKMEEAVPPIGHEEMSHALETPEPPVAKPDGYPMPDPAISLAARDAYGYTDNDMLPLSKERAIELYEKDMTVYMLYEGNGAGMVFDRDDIDDHTGIFGVTREEWEKTQDYLNGLEEKDSQQLENSFLSHSADAFAIYQLKDDGTTRGYRFEPLDRLQAAGLSVERGNYELIYTDLLPEAVKGDAYGRLNELFHRFNMEHPTDFKGHSLSVSDIVALKVDGKVSAHYVDSRGFSEFSGSARKMKPCNSSGILSRLKALKNSLGKTNRCFAIMALSRARCLIM